MRDFGCQQNTVDFFLSTAYVFGMPVLQEAVTKDPILKLIFERAYDMRLGTVALAKASKVSAASLVQWKAGASPQLRKLRAVAKVVGIEICAKDCDKPMDRRKPRR